MRSPQAPLLSPHHPRGRWRRRLALIALVVGALLASSVNAAAQTNSTVGDDASQSAQQVADPAVAFYAAEYGVTESEAIRRLDRIDPIQDILASLRELESTRIAGWGIDHVGPFTGWVWLTGDAVPKPGSTAIADAHDDIEIRTDATHTLAELLEAQARFGDGSGVGPVGRVDDRTPVADYSDAVTFTAPDMDTNALHIGIDPTLLRRVEPSELQGPDGGVGPVGNTDAPATPTTATDAELAALAAKMTAAYQGRIKVAYSIVDGRGYVDTARFEGGRSMSTCTAGFAARERSTRTYGIITAGHCQSSQVMNGVTLPWLKGYASVQADAQLHKIPTGDGHVLTSDFVCSQHSPYTCTVSGDISRYRMRGQIACHTGMASGTSCGTVDNVYFKPTYNGACLDSDWGLSVDCHNLFVRVQGSTLRQCVGDSGGPWFRRNTAYGIHKGGTDRFDCVQTNKVAWFSGIREVESFLNVDILIGNVVTLG